MFYCYKLRGGVAYIFILDEHLFYVNSLFLGKALGGGIRKFTVQKIRLFGKYFIFISQDQISVNQKAEKI